MTREQVLGRLLRQDNIRHPNIALLKKFLLCVHRGWFRVNGQALDEQFSLADYVFDDQGIIFDHSQLSEQAKTKFLNWFLMAHSQQAERVLLNGIVTNEHRGYTAEVALSWWGRITNLLYYQKKSYHWPLAPFTLSLDYQLTNIQICQDKHGLLIGLNQFITDQSFDKYHHDESIDPTQQTSLLNVKRIVLTDALVDELLDLNLDEQDYLSLINNPHPYAIPVADQQKRQEQMHEYRITHRFCVPEPWYFRLWRWCKKIITEFIKRKPPILIPAKDYKILVEEDGLLLQCPQTGEVQIIQQRPDLDSMVFCGGGAKIFAHVGVCKAFEEAGINMDGYAGSSAGAIMAILRYLGYSSPEILAFFKEFRQDNLVHYDIDRTGISDTKAIKAALDFVIIQRVNQIIEHYKIDHTPEGRKFLANQVFAKNKITFASLSALKQAYPDCVLGRELIITATNIKQRKTSYFSHIKTPDLEVSMVGAVSASIPIVFKPTLLDGEAHNDGGILSNFPTEVFPDKQTTLLASEYDNCLSMVAVQFDNGHERSVLDKLVGKIYRENFFWNWVYGFLTGVQDPAGAWAMDLQKLLRYSNQTILVPVDKVSATQFNIDPETQQKLIDNGYQAAKSYIEARYDTEGSQAINQEYLYANFANLQEALYYACFRKNEAWFNRIANEAICQGMSEYKIQALRERHFLKPNSPKHQSIEQQSSLLFSHPLADYVEKKIAIDNMRIFAAIYPVFLKLPYQLIKNKIDLKIFKQARHGLSAEQPQASFAILRRIQGETHVLLALLIQWILPRAKENTPSLMQKIQGMSQLLNQKQLFDDEAFYGLWQLSAHQAQNLFKLFSDGQYKLAHQLCQAIKSHEEVAEAVIEEFDEQLTDYYPSFNY